MSIVFRLSGDEAAVRYLLSWLPQARVKASWKAGDMRVRRVRERSGFNMLLSDADELETAIEETGRVLVRVAKHLVDTPGAFDAEVDVALYVYSSAMASVLLPPTVLSVAASAGLAIRVSAYPCSEDGDEEPATN